MARVAEQAECFEDMVHHVEKILKIKGGDVNNEIRNLAAVGFKNLISKNRAALRTIEQI